MIQIYLCDNDPIILEKYQKQIDEICRKNDYFVKIRALSSAAQLFFELSENPNTADIIFLDIDLGDANGLAVAKHLRSLQYQGQIIFLSMHQQFVFESFDVMPFYYILKHSLSNEKFAEIVKNVVVYASRKKKDFFYCEKRGTKMKIPLQDISYFTINARVVTIYYDNKTLDFYSRINDLLEQLGDKGFFKCHRSFIVNLSYITSIKQHDVYLKNGDSIPVSQSCLKPLKLAFSQFLIQTSHL